MIMKKEKIISWGIFASLVLACLGEFVRARIIGYVELWSTFLSASVLILAFAAVGKFTKLSFFSFLGTGIGITGCILLIGFPSYIPFVGLIFLGISLIAEAIQLVFYIMKMLNKIKAD